MKKRILKCLLAAFMCIVMLSSTKMAAFASYQVRSEEHLCGQINNSYGCRENDSGRSIVVRTGDYCPFCDKIVPEGESHTYMYNSDLYFFRCSRCNVVYSIPYDKPIFAHYTNNVQDYYHWY